MSGNENDAFVENAKNAIIDNFQFTTYFLRRAAEMLGFEVVEEKELCLLILNKQEQECTSSKMQFMGSDVMMGGLTKRVMRWAEPCWKEKDDDDDDTAHAASLSTCIIKTTRTVLDLLSNETMFLRGREDSPFLNPFFGRRDLLECRSKEELDVKLDLMAVEDGWAAKKLAGVMNRGCREMAGVEHV